VNAWADSDPTTLRISIDTKATVHVGDYSRRGQSRGLDAVKAWDHDMRPKEKLVPGGILEPVTGRSFLFFGNSYKTSDFMVDGLLLWWAERKDALSHLKQLVVNMDNGPECSGRRTQFLHRMTEFVDSTGLVIRLIYYPPYHSKYNGIERYWAGLEKSWNGYLLDSVATVLNRAGNFAWRGMQTTVRLLNTLYEKGVKLSIYPHIRPNPGIKKWDDQFRNSVSRYILEHAVYEAALINPENQITEGSRSNIFFIDRAGCMISTPRKDILPGITRKYVLKLAAGEGIQIKERTVSIDSLDSLVSVFISGTSPKVLPVKQIDDFFFDVDHPFLRLLMDQFDQLVQQNLARI